MHKRLYTRLTSRGAIMALNIVLILLMIQGAWDILAGFPQLETEQHAMEEILEGLGTILVAVGVALEERETLLKFLGIYPEGLTPLQEEIDHQCHGYGLSVLLVGLFVEVAVYIVRMPDLNTVDFDPALLLLGVLLCIAGGALLARLVWALWRAPDKVRALN
jgi:hypothetical protein